MRYSIGIDPGLTGALALLRDGQFEAVYDLPVIGPVGRGAVKRAVDVAELRDLLFARVPTSGVTCFLERQSSRPHMHVATIFSLGYTYGLIEAVVVTFGIPLVCITSREWKAYFGLRHDKNEDRACARALFPTAPLDRVRDHNRADALLIARYGWEQETKR